VNHTAWLRATRPRMVNRVKGLGALVSPVSAATRSPGALRIPCVSPSGFASLSALAPTIPPPPGRFSTTTSAPIFAS
jgi:hypothetical protein